MAQTIKLKRSATAGGIPTTSQLELGEVAINTTDGKMYIKKSVSGVETIVDITGGGSSADTILEEFQFTATSNQTTFSGSDDNSETFTYTPNAIQVFLNGILLDYGVDYTATNGTSVVLAETVDANDYLQVFAFKQKISDGSVSVNTFTGNGSTTAFTLSINPGDENNTRVFVDGVYQSKSNYAVSGTTLTFSTAPPTGTAIEVEIGNRNVTLDTTTNLDLPDDVKLRLGTGQDLEIFHDGSNSYIKDVGTGALVLQSAGPAIVLEETDGTNMILANTGGAVTLYHAGSPKLETTSTGVNIQGTIANTSGNMILDSTSDILLDADGGNIMLRDNSVWFGNFNHNGNNLAIDAKIQDGDLVFRGNDGGSVITALTLDMSNAGAATFSSSISTVGAITGGTLSAGTGSITGGSLNVDNISINGSSITSSSNLNLTSSNNDIILDTGQSDIILRGSGSEFGRFFTSSNNFYIKSAISNADLIIQGNDGGVSTNVLTFDMSAAGAATFNSTVTSTGLEINGTRHFDNDYNVTYYRKANHTTLGYQLFRDNGKSFYEWNSGGTHSHDFQFVSNNSTVLSLATNGNVNISNGSLMIGSNTAPAFDLDILDTSTASNTGAGVNIGHATQPQLRFTQTSGNYRMYLGIRTNDLIIANDSGAEKVRFEQNGNVGIGTNDPGCALDITRTSGWAEVHLDGAAGGDLILKDNGVNYGEIYAGSGHGMVLKSYASQHMSFLTNADATAKMTIQSGGNVGIGTTAPGAKLEINSNLPQIRIKRTDGAGDDWRFYSWSGGLNLYAQTASTLFIGRDSPANVITNLDVYTGDLNLTAGAIKVGGTTVIDSNRRILAADGAANVPYITFASDTNTGLYRPGTDILGFSTAGSERARIDASGHVGIRTTPSAWGTDYAVLDLNTGGSIYGTTSGVTTSSNLYFTGSSWIAKNTGLGTLYAQHTGKHLWYSSASVSAGSGAGLSQKMELDASGNLLVGTSDTFPGGGDTNTGVSLTNSGAVVASRDGDFAARFNRKTSYGQIIGLNKDGTPVGSIGTPYAGELYIEGSGANSSGLLFTSGNTIQPRKNGAADNGNIDLGASGNKFKDLHLSGTAYAPLLVTNDIKATGSGGISLQTDEGTKRLEISDSGITTFTKSGGGNIRIAETASRYVEIMGYAEGSANGSTMAFHTIQAGTSTSTERARIDSQGNMGLAKSSLTTWSSGYNALQVGGRGFVGAHSGSDLYVGQNASFNSGWKYQASTAASLTQHSGGKITQFVAPAGTAGNAISWNTAIDINPTGEVAIGLTAANGIALQLGNSANNSAITRVTNGTTSVDLTASSSGKAFLEVGTNHPLILATNAQERMQITTSGYIHMTGASDVRLTLGSEGTAGNNSANWIRGNGNALSFNSAAGNYVWEVGGATKMTLTSSGELQVGATVITSANSSNAFIVKTNHSGNPTALQIGGAGAINGVASSNQSFTILNVAKDSGSGNSAYFHGNIKTAGNINPAANGTQNLGSAGARWANVYTGDLHLSNEEKGGNDIDGTTGNWTVQEGEENLYLINNRTGKKYKFALEEIQ